MPPATRAASESRTHQRAFLRGVSSGADVSPRPSPAEFAIVNAIWQPNAISHVALRTADLASSGVVQHRRQRLRLHLPVWAGPSLDHRPGRRDADAGTGTGPGRWASCSQKNPYVAKRSEISNPTPQNIEMVFRVSISTSVPGARERIFAIAAICDP
jgi:hypothetical protein